MSGHYDPRQRAWVDAYGNIVMTDQDAAAAARSNVRAIELRDRMKAQRRMQCADCGLVDSVDRIPDEGDVYACGSCKAPSVARVRDDQVFWVLITPHELDVMSAANREKLAATTRIKSPAGPRATFRTPE